MKVFARVLLLLKVGCSSDVLQTFICCHFHADFTHFLFQFCYFTLTVLSCVYYDSLGNIFYLMEYREIFLTLLRKFDETQQPRSYLKDLVESTHLFLRMLERFSKGRKNLMVQVKFFSLQL